MIQMKSQKIVHIKDTFISKKQICEAESLKNIIKLSYQCMTENGICDDEEFVITKILGDYEQLVVTNQYNQKYIINPKQIIEI